MTLRSRVDRRSSETLVGTADLLLVMPTTAPFQAHADRYERWFEEHPAVYQSELEALRRLVPTDGRGLEIGVGSGRFAARLGLEFGVDPADELLAHARDRDLDVVRGVAEALPVRDASLDVALIVTTICFVDDIPRTLAEAARALKPEGVLVLGYVDRESPLGRRYREQREENPFYREATFVSTDELLVELEAAGFSEFDLVQTVFDPPEEIVEPQDVRAGHGDGSFVGLAARRETPSQ